LRSHGVLDTPLSRGMTEDGLLRWSLSSGAHSRDPLARNDGSAV
jgi:hypothetical protein